MTGRTKILVTCTTAQEANIIKGNLKNKGVPAMTANENFTTLMPHYYGILGSGVQVLVFEEDYEKALAILESGNLRDKDIRCPNCNSLNVHFDLGSMKVRKMITIVISLLGGNPFNNINNIHHCRDCDTDFNAIQT